jgi:hypothetical protein
MPAYLAHFVGSNARAYPGRPALMGFYFLKLQVVHPNFFFIKSNDILLAEVDDMLSDLPKF